jgi:tetratricopeptide (TPR) repeat protein
MKASPEFKRDFIFAAALALAAAAVYCQTLSFPFIDVWDDKLYVTYIVNRLTPSLGNAAGWFSAPYFLNYIPFTMLSYMLDYLLWGLNPAGYHAQNIFWHAASCVLVFLIFRKAGAGPWLSLFLGAVFALHPQKAESVVLVCQRKDLLSAFFYFAALLCYMKRREKVSFDWIALGLFAASFLSKPGAVSLPFALLAWEIHKSRSFKFSFYARKLGLFFVLCVFFCVFAAAAQAGEAVFTDDYMPWPGRVMLAAENFLRYVRTTFFPFGLSPIYPRADINVAWTPIFKLLAAAAAVTAALFFLWRRSRAAALFTALPLLAAYTASVAPVSGFMRVSGPVDFADRYCYVPSFFIILGAWAALSAAPFGRLSKTALFTLRAAAVILTAGLAWLTVLQEDSWSGDFNFASASYYAGPCPNSVAVCVLAGIELQRGNFDRSAALMDELVSKDVYNRTARDRGLNRLGALINKGNICFYKGDLNGAREIYTAVTRDKFYPDFTRRDKHQRNYILGNLVQISVAGGDIRRGRSFIKEIIDFNEPDSFEALFYKGLLRRLDGDSAAAAELFEQALRMRPGDDNTLKNLELCRP